MKFRRDSCVIRWAYLLDSHWEIPERTSIYPLFWRCVLLTPLKVVMASTVILIPIWLPILLGFRFGWDKVLLIIGVEITVALILVLIAIAERYKVNFLPLPSSPKPKQPSVIREGLKAFKDKVCPLVEIERGR